MGHVGKNQSYFILERLLIAPWANSQPPLTHSVGYISQIHLSMLKARALNIELIELTKKNPVAFVPRD